MVTLLSALPSFALWSVLTFCLFIITGFCCIWILDCFRNSRPSDTLFTSLGLLCLLVVDAIIASIWVRSFTWPSLLGVLYAAVLLLWYAFPRSRPAWLPRSLSSSPLLSRLWW